MKLCDQLCNECSIYIQQQFNELEQKQVLLQALDVSFLLTFLQYWYNGWKIFFKDDGYLVEDIL